MATYTDNYNLTKPTMAETADIRTINGNMDIVDDILHASQVSLADAYDSNETYNTGDIVMYEYLMYKCLDDDVTGTWDATKWERTTAGENGGGGGSDVSITPTLQSGTKIADYEIDGVSGVLYAPAGGGGSGVQKLSWIEYNQLTPAEKSNGTAYFIPDAGANPIATASGSVASFNDGTDNPLNDLKIDINAVQSGSGDPSPSNPRPISGWTGASVTVGGINVWDEELEKGTINNTTGELSSSTTLYRSANKIKVKGGESYYFASNYGVLVYQYRADDSYIGYTDNVGTVTKVFTTNTDTAYIRVRMFSSVSDPTTVNLSINYPSTDTEYHSHINTTTYPLTWQTEAGTVYGGSLDVTSGEMTITHGYIASYDGETINEPWISSIDKYVAGTSPSSGAEVVYPLTASTTESITPTQIRSLLGVNNVWADCGDVEVKYYKNQQISAPQIRMDDVVYAQGQQGGGESEDISDMTWTELASTTATSTAVAIPSGTKRLVLTAELGGIVTKVAEEKMDNIQKLLDVSLQTTWNMGCEYADTAGNHTTISMSVSNNLVTIKSGYNTVTAKVYALS